MREHVTIIKYSKDLFMAFPLILFEEKSVSSNDYQIL